MTRGVQSDMEERIVAALTEKPGATFAQLAEMIPEETPARMAAALHYLSQTVKPARIERTGVTRWYRYWITGTVPANPEPVPRDIRVGNVKGSPGHTAQLVQAVRENPGITAVEIGKLTQIADGAKILAVLVRRGQMQAVGPRTRKRYYAIGHVIPSDAIAPAPPKREPKVATHASEVTKPAQEVANDHTLQRPADMISSVWGELERALAKFPTWPTDPIHALAVLGEEFGELTKDVLQMTYEPGKTSAENVRKEAIQTAAMALRFVASLDAYIYKAGEQHRQHAWKATQEAYLASGGLHPCYD